MWRATRQNKKPKNDARQQLCHAVSGHQCEPKILVRSVTIVWNEAIMDRFLEVNTTVLRLNSNHAPLQDYVCNTLNCNFFKQYFERVSRSLKLAASACSCSLYLFNFLCICCTLFACPVCCSSLFIFIELHLFNSAKTCSWIKSWLIVKARASAESAMLLGDGLTSWQG